MGECQLVISACELDTESLGKTVAEIVGSTCLKCLTIVHKCLDSIGSLSACELITVGLSALNYGHSQILLTEVSIAVEHTLCLFDSLLGRSFMDSMTLLPQEFSGTKERTGSLFPSYNAYPLVIQLGQVAVAVYDISIVLAEQSLGSRSYAESVLKLLASAVSYPCNFGSKALNVILFLLEKALGDKHRHTNILVTQCLETGIEYLLYVLPDSVAIGSYYHTALYACIRYEFCFSADIGIPLCEILIH